MRNQPPNRPGGRLAHRAAPMTVVVLLGVALTATALPAGATPLPVKPLTLHPLPLSGVEHLSSPCVIGVDPSGRILVWEAQTARIRQFSPDGTLLWTARDRAVGPMGIGVRHAVTPEGAVVVGGADGMHRFRPDGTYDGYLPTPWMVRELAAGDGILFAAHPDTPGIHLFLPDGRAAGVLPDDLLTVPPDQELDRAAQHACLAADGRRLVRAAVYAPLFEHRTRSASGHWSPPEQVEYLSVLPQPWLQDLNDGLHLPRAELEARLASQFAPDWLKRYGNLILFDCRVAGDVVYLLLNGGKLLVHRLDSGDWAAYDLFCGGKKQLVLRIGLGADGSVVAAVLTSDQPTLFRGRLPAHRP